MYATYFGWTAFGLIISVLTSTFLIFVPICVRVGAVWFEGIRNSESRPGVASALRKMELMLVQFVIVFVLCAQPLIALDLEQIQYSNTADSLLHGTADGPYSVLTDTSTLAVPARSSIDVMTQDAGGAPRVPLFWALIMKLSSGISHAVAESVPQALDIRSARAALSQFQFDDQQLTSELGRFVRDCYQPARAKFNQWTATGHWTRVASTDAGRILVEHPGAVNWIGSPVFLAVPGLYLACRNADVCGDDLQARHPVSNWPYDATRDGPRSELQRLDGGQPYCSQWWLDPSRGLRERILADARVGHQTRLGNWIEALRSRLDEVSDTALAQDIAVQSVIESNAPFLQGANPAESIGRDDLASQYAGFGGYAASLVSFFGSAYGAMTTVPKVHILKHAMKVLQGALLFIIYALLPFLLLFTGLSLRGAFQGAVAIFTFKFLTALWALANFVDINLQQALYPDLTTVEFLQRSVAIQQSEFIFNIVTALLFVVFPLVFVTIMGWAGVSMGHAVASSTVNTNMASSSAGQAGMSIGQGAVGKATRR